MGVVNLVRTVVGALPIDYETMTAGNLGLLLAEPVVCRGSAEAGLLPV